MPLTAYTGHFKSGKFITADGITEIPDDIKVVITILEEAEDNYVKKTKAQRQVEGFKKIIKEIQNDKEELGSEFDEILNQRIKFREIDL